MEGVGAEITDTYIQNKVGSSNDIQNAEIYFRKKGLLTIQMMELQILDFGIYGMVFQVAKGFTVIVNRTMEEALEKVQWLADMPTSWEDDSELE